MDDIPDLLKASEVAAALRVTSRTVSRMVEDGRLKAVYLGTRQRFHREDVLAVLTDAPKR